MLSRLAIRNIGLIENTELELSAGLTIITGETGAGKSMFIDALSLALGDRADTSLLKKGVGMGIVEATFNILEGSVTAEFCNKAGIPLEGREVTLRRILSEDKSRAFINGVTVTQAQLRELGETLVDIHGQYDHQFILKPTNHSKMLDNFGGLTKQAQAVEKAYEEWHKVYEELNDARMRARAKEEEEELYTAYVQELEDMDIKAGEEEKLTEERTLLLNSEKVTESLNGALTALTAEADVCHSLTKAESALQTIAEQVGGEALALSERLTSLSLELSDTVRELEALGNSFEAEPERLGIVDERLFALRDMARKHKVEVNELPETLEAMKERLEQLGSLQTKMDDLEKETATLWEAFTKACIKLSKSRKEISATLSKEIEKSLENLQMKGTRFQAKLPPLEEEKWGRSGAETVEFMVATNKGADLQPLVKVASGGEVSRLMLALKQVFYTTMPHTTLVFDEIDTGVGGSVADAMGTAMKELAKQHQVFSITHLPQVAAKGDAHLKIEKSDTEETTITDVKALELSEREQELARMLSGKEVTKQALEAARALLQ